MIDITSTRLENLKKAKDLLTEITYGIVDTKKVITSVKYSSVTLKLEVTESFTYDIDGDIESIQLS